MHVRQLTPRKLPWIAVAAFALATTPVQAEWLLHYGFENDSQPEIIHDALTAPPFFLSDDLIDEGVGGERRASGWALGAAVDLDRYWGFSFTAAAGRTVDVAEIRFNYEGKNNGPVDWFLRHSGDGYTADLASGAIVKAKVLVVVDVSSLGELTGNQQFRIYGTGGTGEWRLDDITLVGEMLPLSPGCTDGIACDPFTDGSYDNSPDALDPKDLDWYTDTAGDSLSIVGLNQSAALRLKDGLSTAVAGGFLGASYDLDVIGKSMTLSFDFRLPTTGANDSEGFRFGLLDDGGTHLTANGVEQTLSYKGYHVRIGTLSSSGLKLLREEGGDKTMLDGGDEQELASDGAYDIDESTDHSAELKLTRAAGGILMEFLVDDVLIKSALDSDVVEMVTSFSTVGFAIEENHVVIDNVQVKLGGVTDIGVSIAASLDAVPEGYQVVFSITAENTSPTDATGVQVTSLLPAGLTYISKSTSDYNEITGVWTIGSLGNGQNTSMTVTAQMDAGQACNVITTEADVTALNEVDSSPGNDADEVDVIGLEDDLEMASFSVVATGVKMTWARPCGNGIEYDVLYVDADHFTASLSNQWSLLETTTDGSLIDSGQVSGVAPGQLRQGANKDFRFYRLAYKDLWKTVNPVRFGSDQVCLTTPMVVRPGENWLALPGIVSPSTPLGMMGTNLPAFNVIANATKVSWFNKGAANDFAVSNQVFLMDLVGGKAWMTSPLMGPVGPANHMPAPPRQPVFVEIPSGAGVQAFQFVGKLPGANPPGFLVSGDAVGADPHLTFVNPTIQPVPAHPSAWGLTNVANGFRGGSVPIPAGPAAVDFLWKFNAVTQSALGDLVWLRTSDNTWRFARAGHPVVPPTYFKSTDAIIIRRAARVGNAAYSVSRSLRYPAPTRNFTP